MDVLTHLMFQDGRAHEAARCYVDAIPNSSIDEVVGPDGPGQVVRFSLGGRPFMAFDSPPVHDFTFTPATSTFVLFDTPEQVDSAFSALADGGAVLMPVDGYDFNARYGWCVDRFGVSWQLGLAT